jgi:serine protease
MTKRAQKSGLHRLVVGAGVLLSLITTAAYAQSGPYSFYSLTPCRVVDTRNAPGTNGGPNLGTTRRDFAVKGNCGVPTTAKAVSLNIAVTGASTSSWLTVWPAGQAMPNTAAINFSQNDWALSNGAIVGLAAGSPDLSVQNANGTVAVIIDVTGYFQ